MTNEDADGNPNVFQMIVAHGGPGFWVRRTTWEATCARVVGVAAFAGPPPYYGNPPVIVDVYSLDGKLKDSFARLSVPGTYKTWRRMDPPEWARSIRLRGLDDPAIAEALAKHDRRRKPSAAVAERIDLSVPFALKEKAKAIGAKWDAAQRTWWIPSDEPTMRKAIELGFLSERQAARSQDDA